MTEITSSYFDEKTGIVSFTLKTTTVHRYWFGNNIKEINSVTFVGRFLQHVKSTVDVVTLNGEEITDLFWVSSIMCLIAHGADLADISRKAKLESLSPGSSKLLDI